MKTPEKIKKGMECCFTSGKGCDYCPYCGAKMDGGSKDA